MSNKGFALVTMLMVVSVVGILTAGSLILSVTNLRLTRNDATSSQALAAAQAASAYWRAELVSLYIYMIENFEEYQDDVDAYNAANPDNQIACGNFMAIGVDTDRDGTPDVGQNQRLPEIEIPVGGSIAKANVMFYTRGSAIVLDSQASVNGARGRMVDEFRVSALDMWNNAVFAGNTAATASIQGRAEIRGSVHILGEGLTSGSMALDLNGDFALGNTYRGLNPTLVSNLTDPTSSNYMRLTTPDPTDLCATLRVKRGYVKMQGKAKIGFAESTNPDPYMDMMSGIFTNDGIQGGELGVTVHSLNGMNAAYDAGNNFRFPYLDDLNPETGMTWREGLAENSLTLSKLHPSQDDRNKSQYQGVTADNASHGQVYLTPECFDDHPDNMSNGLFGVDQNGEPTMVIKKGNGAGSTANGFVLKWGVAGSSDSSKLPTPKFSCAKKRKNIYGTDETLTEVIWDDTKNELYVGGKDGKGVVRFLGDNLLFTGPNTTGDAITYRGDGIFFTEDELGKDGGVGGIVELEFDFLPAPGKAPVQDEGGGYAGLSTTKDNTFPATALLALVADKNIISTGAQQRFTIAVYAENYMQVTKQTLLAGSVVTRAFHAGSNVPTVLYVPNLAERLSDLLPGTDSKSFAVSNVAFSRR